VKNGLLAAIIPFDSYARPIPFREDALITWISIPADAVADSEGSGWLPVITHSRYGGTAASIVRRKPFVRAARALESSRQIAEESYH